MDPETSSSSASPSPAPSPSTDPLPFDVSTSTAQECLIALGILCSEDHSTEAVEAILSHHPEIMLSIQSLIHYKTALLCDSTTRRLECLNDAVESSCQAIALSPNTISFALFHAILLFQLARNDPGLYEAVVQECDHALLIENPTEPGYEVPVQALRLKKMREVIVDLTEKSKCQIIVLGGGNRRDKWKRLVEDNSLAEVKAEFEAALRRKRRIPGRRAPPDFESPSPDDRLTKKKMIKKHKKVESNDVATISRVRAFWNDKMSVKEKRKLLRIGIEDLKVYLDKNKFGMAKEVLTEAIDYAKAENIWSFWACSYCRERVIDSDMDKHLMGHLGTVSISETSLSLLPDGAPKLVVDMVEKGVWKPVESISATTATADWPHVEDSERAEIIKRIHAKLQLFTGRKCLTWRHLNALQNLIIELLQKNHNIPKLVIMDLWLHHTLQLICSLEAPELNLVLQLLEDLANACALHCLGDIISEEDVRGNNWFWGNARESLFFSSDLSALLFDDRLLRGQTVEPANGTAVLTSIPEHCVADYDCDSDAFVSWLWTEGPTIGEQIRAWVSLREASPTQGMELYKIVEDESRRLNRMCERKGEYLRYEKPLENVEKTISSLCVDENSKREQISQGYVSLLFKRWKELENESEDDEGAAELDIIWSIMKESEADFEIQMAIQRQKNRLAQELYQLDAIIAATLSALEQTGLQAGMVTMFDYRFALVPQLKSFMKARLEDLAYKDAAEKSNAAAKALLAELPDDKNTNKGKSKNKKKKKDHIKAKDSEAAGGSEEQHPTSVPVVSPEPYEDIGSSEQQHPTNVPVVSPDGNEDFGSSGQQHPTSVPIVFPEPNEDVGSSQSGPAPLPVSSIQFGNLNWTNVCQSKSFKK
ncbi:uncharacterized protein LOC132164421 [Corylus avellana]|uniref:uncharacterized protein LOC132164421 n=1 Tax=Corylus avellana TaxID=13451 RepID=UPI00286CF496|nr:uncharacterized protein LOC132164421 [Corylus avellana]